MGAVPYSTEAKRDGGGRGGEGSGGGGWEKHCCPEVRVGGRAPLLRAGVIWNPVSEPRSRRCFVSLWDLLSRPRSLSPPHPHAQVWCRCITTIFNYFVVTNFFWMFVEGCYLHTAIVMTYSTEHLRKWLFLFTGWCEGPRVGGRASWERGTAGKTPPLVLRLRAGAQPAPLPPCSPCCRPMPSRPMPQDSSARHPCAISGCICFLPSARPPSPPKVIPGSLPPTQGGQTKGPCV